MITGFTVPISHWGHPQHNRGLSEIFHHNNEAIERKTPQKKEKTNTKYQPVTPQEYCKGTLQYIYLYPSPDQLVPSQQARFPFDLLAQSLRWVNYSTFVMSQTFSAMEDGSKSFYLYSLSLLVPSRVHQGPEFPHSVVGNFRGIMYS